MGHHREDLADSRHRFWTIYSYVIAYRDCCGKPACGAGKSCWCDGADREMPIYRSTLNNDIIWCFGNASATYHCSTAALVGLANT